MIFFSKKGKPKGLEGLLLIFQNINHSRLKTTRQTLTLCALFNDIRYPFHVLMKINNNLPSLFCFDYDYMGRRVSKRTFTCEIASGGGTAWVPDKLTRFIWRGWVLIAEIDGATGEGERYFHWSSGMAGGLLAIRDETEDKCYLPAYDGNGNVTALVEAATGTIAAAYEYTPFGELLRKHGDYAAKNPFRWSTQYGDDETGLVYYGYRYYSPRLGRFINQDPIKEWGGINLYAFTGNNPVNFIDLLGLDDYFSGGWDPPPDNENDYYDDTPMTRIVIEPDGNIYYHYATGLYFNSYGDLTNSGWDAKWVGHTNDSLAYDKYMDTISIWSSYSDDAPESAGVVVSGGSAITTPYPNEEIVVLPQMTVTASRSLGIAAMLASRAVTAAGQVTGAMEVSRYYRNPLTGAETWTGRNGTIYNSTTKGRSFNGNQYTGGKLKYARAGSTGVRLASRALFVVGAAFSIRDIIEGHSTGNTSQAVRGYADLTMGYFATVGGPVGLTIGGFYFGVTIGYDVFVPALTENYVKHGMDPSNF
jgi:RHS repeat-associated protein